MADQAPAPGTPPTDFQRGPVSPDQQPYGAAAAENALASATQAAAPPADQAPLTLPPETTAPAEAPPPEEAPPAEPGAPAEEAPPEFPPLYNPTTENDQHLFAPGNPAVPMIPQQPIRIYDFPNWISALADAAMAPDANDSTKALFRLVMASPLP